MYGVKNRNIIPLFSPSANVVSPLLTLFLIVVRHMAHCAQEKIGSKESVNNISALFMTCESIIAIVLQHAFLPFRSHI